MKAVEHGDERYLLVKQSSESSRVRDPATGEERYLPNEELTVLDDGPLETAAAAVEGPLRALLRATNDDRGLGLLVELHTDGPLAVRDLLARYDLCESDALGLVTEFRVAGLVSETTVAGERGYALTDQGREAVDALLS